MLFELIMTFFIITETATICNKLTQLPLQHYSALLIMKDSLLVSLLVKIDQVNENYQTWMRQHILIVDCSHQPGLTVSCLFRKIKILIVFMTNNIPEQIFSVESGATLPAKQETRIKTN